MEIENNTETESCESSETQLTDVPTQAELVATLPGQLRVIKRNGVVTQYDDSKIAVAITKAFLAVEGGNAAASTRIHEIVALLVEQITENFQHRWPTGGTIHIEAIQDQVELLLMRESEYKAAKAYVLYREERRRARAAEQQDDEDGGEGGSSVAVIYPNGNKSSLTFKQLEELVQAACRGLTDVDAQVIVNETEQNLFNDMSIAEVHKALVMSARAMIENEPNYTFVAARLLLNLLTQESLHFLGIDAKLNNDLNEHYPEVFKHFIERGIELDMLDPKLKEFDLDKLAKALDARRDFKFTYLSLQTVYDRYLIRHENTRYELPQIFFMRIAMGLALAENDNKEERAIEFYHVLSKFDFMSATPTLLNAGTQHPQLSSSFLTSIPDDLDGIYSALKDNAILSKFTGGLGNDWTLVRAMGAHIKGTNGKSLGVVPFMNVADATAIAINSGEKRKSNVCGYLETWHMDVEEFLELRKNAGDNRRRTYDMNTANWIPDLFMKRVFRNKDWTLFSPDEVPDLHDRYGLDFEIAYLAYEEQSKRGEIRSKTISAISLWRKMLSVLFETGYPWLTFKDPCNLRSSQQHTGVIHSSNLCTEITLNTSQDEVAVCNLGSINLVNHLTEQGLDIEKIKHTVSTAIRMLDNAIDVNYYTVPQARKSNLRHRPVALGIMGFQDALYTQRLPYASQEAVKFADRSMEVLSYYAIKASTDLAEERGTYASFEGSLWSKGILPIDSINILAQARGEFLEQDRSHTLDWNSLRERVATVGMRNSNTLAIAPTATIANICGVSQSIEPTYKNLYVKSNISGEFTIINAHLVKDLKKLDLWDKVMVNDLKYFNGSVRQIDRIPEDIKNLYATAFEVEPRWLVEAGSRRQKWLDQSQSLNLYMDEPSTKKIDVLYRMAWLKGLKTTYYFRTIDETSTEKSTSNHSKQYAVDIHPPSKVSTLDETDQGTSQ